jgi:HK97 family phage major capsid protein/HK97 family phage prohead protease
MSEVKEERHLVDVQEDATTLTITMEKNPPEPEGITEGDDSEEGGGENAADEEKDQHRAAMVMAHRSVQAEVRALEEDNVVELAFSSEMPVEREGFMEVLDHSEGSADLSRLNNGAPLLLNHNTDDQIGVVESARVDDDKVGRAVVRFSKSERAQEIYRDVKDGIRRLVSVGYYVLKTVRERATDGLDTLRVTSFLPLELSVVPVPADPSVGVGRGVEVEQPQQKENIIMSQEIKEKETPNVEVIAENTRNAELKRSKELTALGARYNCMDDAHNAIQDGKTAGEFSRWILDNQLKTEPVQDKGEILAPREEKRFSLCNAIAGYLKDGRFGGYEAEVSEEAQKRYGRVTSGLLIPNDLQVRDITAGSSSGADTVATVVDSNFVDRLSNMVVVEQAGATVLSGLQGNVGIPRLTTGSTGYWVAETGSPTESSPVFDQISLTPKRLSVHIDVSKQLMVQSTLDMENVLRNDILKGLAIAEDAAAIVGGGTNEPSGILDTTGIGNTGTGQTLSYSEVWACISEVDQDNALMGDLAWLTSAKGRAALATTEVASSTAKFLLDNDGRVAGYPLFVSNNVPDTHGTDDDGTAFIFGNMSDLIIGRWNGVEVLVDPYTSAHSGIVRLIVSLFTDIAVRHAESFSKFDCDL